jgi:pyrimidine-specific ribonucleoside hydrolase
VAIAHLADPALVRTQADRVDVERASELTLGRTVVDREGLSGMPANADVSVGIDRDRFLALIREALARFP